LAIPLSTGDSSEKMIPYLNSFSFDISRHKFRIRTDVLLKKFLGLGFGYKYFWVLGLDFGLGFKNFWFLGLDFGFVFKIFEFWYKYF